MWAQPLGKTVWQDLLKLNPCPMQEGIPKSLTCRYHRKDNEGVSPTRTSKDALNISSQDSRNDPISTSIHRGK